MPELWTIGHGTRPIADFLLALRAHGIGVLADVRQFPSSKRNPQFTQAALRLALESAGIRYVHLVDLGGYRDEGYEAHMGSIAWRDAFSELATLAAQARVAVMCAERAPQGCHRSLIASHAAGLGWAVTHILDAGRTLAERRTRQAKLDAEGSSGGSA